MAAMDSLNGTLRETIPAVQGDAFGNTATRILAGTEVLVVPATRSTYFIDDVGMGRWAEVTLSELHALVDPS